MIIFSADDYGYSKYGSYKILLCNEKENIIRNTSILSNIASSDIMHNLKDSRIIKGIHMNIVEGKSLGNHRTITNEDGIFYTKSILIKKILTNKIDFQEIFNEIILQLNYILDFSINITYADSHQNLHLLPPIMNQYKKALKKYNIIKVRGQTPYYSWFSKSFHAKHIFHKLMAASWNQLYSKSLLTSNKIILKAPGMGLHMVDINEALCLWDIALKKHKINVLYEVPCHLDFSEFEFQLYSSSEFSDLLIKHAVIPLSYAEI